MNIPSFSTQVAAWLLLVLGAGIVIPTTSSSPPNPFWHLPLCGLIITTAGYLLPLLSLQISALTPAQGYRRVIIMRTVLLWSIPATWFSIAIIHKVLLSLSNEHWWIVRTFYQNKK